MNVKVTDTATKIVDALITCGSIKPETKAETVTVVADVLNPIMYPETCSDCGTVLCPECGAHLEAAITVPKTEFEGYPMCIYCQMYVKPDKTLIPLQPDKDGRFVDLTDALRGRKKAPEKKEWVN